LAQKELQMKAKMSTKVSKVLEAWCKSHNLDEKHVRLMVHGEHLDKSKTLKECGVEDGDTIDAVIEQTGGRAQ
jgi:small ubiquitin-related modifier